MANVSMPLGPPTLVRSSAVREGIFEPNPRNVASATPYNDAENLRIARETADRLAAEAAERRNARQDGVNGGKRRKTHRRKTHRRHRRKTHRRKTHRRRRSHRRH